MGSAIPYGKRKKELDQVTLAIKVKDWLTRHAPQCREVIGVQQTGGGLGNQLRILAVGDQVLVLAEQGYFSSAVIQCLTRLVTSP